MNKIAIFDSDFIPWYCCHIKKDAPEKTFEDIKQGCVNLINNINNALDADYMIHCFTKGKCFRYDIYPQYKANRKYLDPPKYLFETKQWLIENFKGNFVENLYEADDLVCIYKNMLSDKDNKCIIVSPDKDILNLEGKHYNPKLNQWVITCEEDANYLFWRGMMVGDTADHLPGVKGIGIKTADELLRNSKLKDYKTIVFDKYCEVYGEQNGVEMFYKMYKCLSMVQKDVNLPKPNIMSIDKISEEERLFTEDW